MALGKGGLPMGDALRYGRQCISIKAGDRRGKLVSQFVVVCPDVIQPLFSEKNLEARHSSGTGLLANGGASRANVFTGDASDSLFTFSSVADKKVEHVRAVLLEQEVQRERGVSDLHKLSAVSTRSSKAFVKRAQKLAAGYAKLDC